MADYRIALPFWDFEMSNPSDVWHPPATHRLKQSRRKQLRKQISTRSWQTARRRRLDVGVWLNVCCLAGCQVFVGFGQCYGSWPETRTKIWTNTWIRFNKIWKIIDWTPEFQTSYCWWKKSCTTWDVYNPRMGDFHLMPGPHWNWEELQGWEPS